MINQLNLYIALIYLIAAIPYAWLGLYAWRKRPAVAVTPFAWAMLAMSTWAFMYSLEIFLPTLPTKIFIVKLEYLGIISVPVFLLFFALEFTGKSHLLTLRTRSMVWGIPILTLILVWTNQYHHLMWDMESISITRGIKLLDIRFGFFFGIHVLYSYILLAYTNILLIVELIQRPRIYRIQISFVVLGILIPVIGSLIFISGINPIKELDVTPLFFLPTALGLSWAITKYRLLEILPPEHLTVLETMKDGVIVLNPQGRVLYINPIMEKLINRTENDAIGQPLSQLSEQYTEKLKPYLAGGEHRAEMMIREGRQEKFFELNVSPVSSLPHSQNQIHPDTIIILHDITERKETELALTRRESIMSAISMAAEQFLKESAWEHNVPGVLAHIGQAANVSRIYIITNDTDADGVIRSSLCYEWADPRVASQINNPALKQVPLRAAGFGRWESYLSRGLPIYGKVSEFPAEEQVFLQALGSLSIAAMPIFVDSQWWGFIMFDECLNERSWTGTELEALYIAANIFGSAESRARTEQKLIRRQRTLNLLHELVSISLQSRDIKDMAQTIVERLVELIHADGCFLALWDEASNHAIPLAAYGPFAEIYSNLEVKPGALTLTESALKMGVTLVVEDTKNTPHADEYIKDFPSHSVLALPLIAMKQKLGSIILAFDNRHIFQPEEILVSEQAAALIALAMEKFKAVEQAQRRADTSETLRKAGAAVTKMLELDNAINQILDQLNQVVPYDSASVQLLDNNELEIVGGRGWDNPAVVIGIRFRIPGDNPNSVVIETGKPYHLPETWKVYKAFQEAPHDHIRSWLGVPLIAQEKIIGLLAIDSSEANHFTEEDINIASEFANQVAVALENARIFEETQSQAITDSLTGLYNRRGLSELGKVEFARSVRGDNPFSAIMIDLDRFKKVNDAYGHAAGDQVLCEYANRCKSCVREIDYIGRYGGEEIVILLPDTSMNASLAVAERLRVAIANTPIRLSEGQELNITASLGVACKDENITSLETLIARADQAMYAAKHKGRNQVASDH